MNVFVKTSQQKEDLLRLLAYATYHNGWVLVEFKRNPLYRSL